MGSSPDTLGLLPLSLLLSDRGGISQLVEDTISPLFSWVEPVYQLQSTGVWALLPSLPRPQVWQRPGSRIPLQSQALPLVACFKERLEARELIWLSCLNHILQHQLSHLLTLLSYSSVGLKLGRAVIHGFRIPKDSKSVFLSFHLG